MAITASTSSVDAIVRGGPGKSLFDDGKSATGTGSTWNQGDFICYDSTLTYLRAVTATGDAVKIVGVADNAITSGQLNSPYGSLTPVNAAQVTPGFAGPKYGVTVRATLKTSDAFVLGGKVYLANGGDTQTISSSDPGDGNYIGIFVGPGVASAAAGQTGDFLIGARYPSATGTGLNFG